MRLFYQIDGYNNWSELDHIKAGLMAGDKIICHTDDLRDRFLGERLIMGIEFSVIRPATHSFEIKKDPAELIFFTKKPANLTIHRNGGIRMDIDVGPAWFDTL